MDVAGAVGHFKLSNPGHSQDPIFVQNVSIRGWHFARSGCPSSVRTSNVWKLFSPIVPGFPVDSVDQVTLHELPEKLHVGYVHLLLEQGLHHVRVGVVHGRVLGKGF